MNTSTRRVIGFVTLALLFSVASCEDAETTEVALPTSQTSPAPLISEVPPSPREFSLVILRDDPEPDAPVAGTIWVADADGGNIRQVTPQGMRASYAGVAPSKSGSMKLYYVSQDTETARTIWGVDLNDGATARVLSYEDRPKFYSAAVSPDARYIVHTQSLGLDMYDIATGNSVTLFQSGSGPDCLANILEQCFLFLAPAWSPDGRLLKVVHSVYEGGWSEVIDPFQSPPAVLTNGDRTYPQTSVWSPRSDALCAYGVGLAEPSGLYLLETPEWEARNLLPEFEESGPNSVGRWVQACDWPDNDTVAYIVMTTTSTPEAELWTYNRPTGQFRVVATLPDSSACCGAIVATTPGSRHAVTQVLAMLDNNATLSQPAVVDLDTGAITHMLEVGDLVLDAFAR